MEHESLMRSPARVGLVVVVAMVALLPHSATAQLDPQWTIETVRNICRILGGGEICDVDVPTTPSPIPPTPTAHLLVGNVATWNGGPAPPGTRMALVFHGSGVTARTTWSQPWNAAYRFVPTLRSDIQQIYLFDHYGNKAIIELQYRSLNSGNFLLRVPEGFLGGHFFVTTTG